MAKEQPHPAVVEWLAQSEDVDLFLSVITIEEIREGIELMDAGKRKRRLDLWLGEELLSNYRERILPIPSKLRIYVEELLETRKPADLIRRQVMLTSLRLPARMD